VGGGRSKRRCTDWLPAMLRCVAGKAVRPSALLPDTIVCRHRAPPCAARSSLCTSSPVSYEKLRDLILFFSHAVPLPPYSLPGSYWTGNQAVVVYRCTAQPMHRPTNLVIQSTPLSPASWAERGAMSNIVPQCLPAVAHARLVLL